ncbi:MAG: hypothetical protein KAU14_07975 [Thermoplasmata archaeon]|nr:hypothetical protein [Thermoplasmata archaeon]
MEFNWSQDYDEDDFLERIQESSVKDKGDSPAVLLPGSSQRDRSGWGILSACWDSGINKRHGDRIVTGANDILIELSVPFAIQYQWLLASYDL